MGFWARFLSRSLSAMLFCLPRWARFAIGDFLGLLWFDVFRIRRNIVLSNLALAFPTWTHSERVRVGRQSLCNMGRSFIEILTLPSIDESWVRDNVVFEGFENLPEDPKGYFFLTLHLGNGDLACSMLPYRGLKVHLISKKFKIRWLNDFWFKIRSERGTEFIEPHGKDTAFKILKALKAKEIVIFVLDQFMGKPYGVKTRFFGVETGTAYGLALFALKTEAPVYPIYTWRDTQGKTRIRVEAPIEAPEETDRDVTIQLMTQKFNDKLETFIQRHPEQWMWVHRRWKEF